MRQAEKLSGCHDWHPCLLSGSYPKRICSAFAPLQLRSYRNGGKAEQERSKTVSEAALPEPKYISDTADSAWGQHFLCGMFCE